MTEQNPPQDRPEFQPPGGDPGAQPVAPPPQPYQPPPPQQYPPPPSQQYPPPPPQQYTPPPQPGNYPPYQLPPPQPKTGRGSIWLGIGITIAALLGSWGLAVAVPYDSPLASTMSLLAAGLPFALVLGGIVMAAIPRTTRTGAGILIAGGLCFALVLGLGSGG